MSGTLPNANLNTQGTDTNLLTAGTVSASTGVALCTDANHGATTSGCPGAPTVTAINLAAATGNCSTQTFLTPGANALYRVGATVTITTNAGTSSSTPAIAVSYTDADSNTTVSTNAGTIVNSSGANAVGPVPTLGPIYINAKSGTAITFSCSGYASNPVLTMAYTVHARLEGTF